MKTLLFLLISSFANAQQPALTKIRIGWQIPWSTQGQLVQVLKHTDILKKNGLEAEFIGRSFGPELNELALAKSVDVVLTGDQPALVLISKNQGWKAIGRLMYNRATTLVPVTSEVKGLEDLKGKTIGLPFGAAAERVFRQELKALKMDADKDVKLVNLAMPEHGPLVKKYSTEKKWGNFDALVGFDPVPAILEAKKIARAINTGKIVSLVVMSEAITQKDGKIAKQFMQALFDAYDYYRLHSDQATDWFLKESQLDDPQHVACNLASQLEPNLSAKKRSDMRLSLSAEDLEHLEKVSLFLEKQLKAKVEVKNFVNLEAAQNLK